MKSLMMILLSMMLFVVTTSFAKSPEISMREEISTHIEFPKPVADLQLEGTVFAEFTVREDGNIEVINCFSLVGELQSYVFQELSKIIVTPDAGVTGKPFLMKFDFKLIKI